MVAAFQPNGVSALDAAPPLEPTRQMDGPSFIYPHRVKSYELDNLGHVNNANYLNWLNQARLEAWDQAVSRQRSAVSGQPSAVSSQPSLTPLRYEIEYFLPAVAGDNVEVHSRVVAAGETQLTWTHEIRRGAEQLATARATVGFESPASTFPFAVQKMDKSVE